MLPNAPATPEVGVRNRGDGRAARLLCRLAARPWHPHERTPVVSDPRHAAAGRAALPSPWRVVSPRPAARQLRRRLAIQRIVRLNTRGTRSAATVRPRHGDRTPRLHTINAAAGRRSSMSAPAVEDALTAQGESGAVPRDGAVMSRSRTARRVPARSQRAEAVSVCFRPAADVSALTRMPTQASVRPSDGGGPTVPRVGADADRCTLEAEFERAAAGSPQHHDAVQER